MTERDAFELRFAAAVRGYVARVSSDLDPVDLAHRIAAAEPRRRGLAGSLARRGVAIPRAAWVVLLAAGLLAALVGGTLLVGSQLQRRLPALLPPVGTTFACPPGSTPDKPGPVDQARPSEVSHLSMAFDRRAGRLVAVVDVDDAVETWTFDVCTNTWTRMRGGLGRRLAGHPPNVRPARGDAAPGSLRGRVRRGARGRVCRRPGDDDRLRPRGGCQPRGAGRLRPPRADGGLSRGHDARGD
jgi:hypothetical protein